MLLLVTSCTTLPTAEEEKALYDQVLKQKRDQLVQDKVKDCYLTAVKEADAFVDSILYQVLDLNLLDSIEMIERPYRPERPAFIRDVDTSKVRPLFEVKNSK